MKTVKNHLSAVAFALISVVAIYNSHNSLMLAPGDGRHLHRGSQQRAVPAIVSGF